MGVKGLWQHLAPAARKISLEQLEGQVLAIDVSIWVIQFLNSNQKNNDYNVIDGFLRRICKLLYFGIKPVFVFDGSTPQIKKKTLMLRRKYRQKQQINYGKAAEKLLHNIVKETLIKQIQAKQGQANVGNGDHDQISSLQDIEKEEEEKDEDQSSKGQESGQDDAAQITKVLVDKYKNLLEENDIDIEIFQSLDTEEQYEVIDQLQRVQRDIKRERFISVQDDLGQFSEVQMQNFITSIKEKQRQKDIMIKASEAELRSMGQVPDEKRIASNSNLRFIYRENTNQNKGQLPQSIVKIIENAKAKRTRGRGKNNIEQFFHKYAQQPLADIQDLQEVYNKAPLDIIKNQLTRNQTKHLTSEEQEEALLLEQKKERELEEFNNQRQLQLETMLDNMFGTDDEGKDFDKLEDIQIPLATVQIPEFTMPENFYGIRGNSDELQEDKHEYVSEKQDVSEGSDHQKDDGIIESLEVGVKAQDGDLKPELNAEQQAEVLKRQELTRQMQYEMYKNTFKKLQVDEENVNLKPKFATNDEITQQQPHDQIGTGTKSEDIKNQVSQSSEEHKNDQQQQISTQSKKRKADATPDQFYINTMVEEQSQSAILVDSNNSQYDSVVQHIEFEDFDNAPSSTAQNNDYNIQTKDLEKLKQDLLEENIYLIQELEKSAKSFAFFSQENTQELKTLLKLCGIPYVQAPFEAESQCAFLEQLGLVDGVITEDSDVLLFGARKVYRNIFDRNKFVEKFDMKVIENEMGLDREDLIKMALFMGSDYTIGVRGIAAVNAIEIINSFPGDDGLSRFKSWVDIKQQILDQQNQENQKKEGKSHKKKLLSQLEAALSDDPIERPDCEIENEYKENHKNWRRHWEFPHDFPSQDVINAYVHPSIDDDKEDFSWGAAAFKDLKVFAVRNLNWGAKEIQQYFDHVEVRMKQREKQEKDKKKGTIEQYFKREEKFAAIQSIRVAQAVQDLQQRKKKFKKSC